MWLRKAESEILIEPCLFSSPSLKKNIKLLKSVSCTYWSITNIF